MHSLSSWFKVSNTAENIGKVSNAINFTLSSNFQIEHPNLQILHLCTVKNISWQGLPLTIFWQMLPFFTAQDSQKSLKFSAVSKVFKMRTFVRNGLKNLWPGINPLTASVALFYMRATLAINGLNLER